MNDSMRILIGYKLVQLYKRHTEKDAIYFEDVNEISYVDDQGMYRREKVSEELKQKFERSIHEAVFNQIEAQSNKVWN